MGYFSNSRRENYRPAPAKQAWEPGQTVKVGFMSLQVIAKIPTPGDYRPDAYALKSSKGQFYQFVPHFGVSKCSSLDDAMSVQ